MLINFDRLIGLLARPIMLVIAAAVIFGLGGLLAAVVVDLLNPLTALQYRVVVIGFSAFGLIAGIVEVLRRR